MLTVIKSWLEPAQISCRSSRAVIFWEPYIKWVAKKLNLPPERVAKLNREKGKQLFEVVLAKAVDDGVVDEEEAARLEQIAVWVGDSVSGFVHAYFKDQGESFLRGFFLMAVGDGKLMNDEWNRLIDSTRRLDGWGRTK